MSQKPARIWQGARGDFRIKPLYVLVPSLALGACTGMVTNPSGSNGTSNGTGTSSGVGATGSGASSDPVTGSQVMTEPTWRLTNAEYANTVHDLLGIDLTTPLDPDGASAGFNAGLQAGDATVQAYHSAAIEASSQSAALLKLVPCDQATITSNPADCAGKFIDAIGPKAFRRPLDADTRTGLTTLFAAVFAQFGFAGGLQALVEEMLQSPYFLYHLELEEQAKGPGQVAVTGYSMASRLSYLIWASMPDDELFAKASAGQLTSASDVETEASRMLADPKAQAGLRNFYEQWLSVRDMPLSKGGNFANSYDGPSILGSFDAQVDAALWAPQNGLTTLLTGTQAFVNATTAPLFGVTGITGTAFQPVSVNPMQRAGILMHPAIMATFATDTGSHPIKRGVFVWDQILCQRLSDPPPNIPTFPGVPPNSSVRQAYEAFTSPALCQGCHARINPVGFLFENYDTIGQYRTIDDNGQPVNSDVTVVGAVDSNGNPDTKLDVETPNALKFVANLASDSGIPTQCMVTQLYRYALKRLENDADQATLSSLSSAYTGGAQNMSKLLGGLTQTQGFLNRLNVQ
ncbi:MAG TPA: DUF1588 domain-containing protein [Polyangiaceae bacterium]|jgi:hypothetical protein|nr:DUF1588 domain-containing protein [Polyangiaceae bacterium]